MNQRVYTQTDINTFKFIKELRENEKLSLKAIRKVLRRAGVVTEEAAAANEAAVVSSSNNAAAAVNRLRVELISEVDRVVANRNNELKEEIVELKERMYHLEHERNAKLDEFIAEWRSRNKHKGLFSSIFK